MPHVVVIGAGMAGLAAAWDLVDVGCDVTILEAGDRVGGKLRSASIAGATVDVGAESALAVRPELTDLIHRVGLEDRVVEPATTSAAVWSRGALRPLPRGTVLGVPGEADALGGLLTTAEVDRVRQELPYGDPVGRDVAIGEYVAARLGDAVVDRLIEPLLGGVYAGHARSLSLRAVVPALWPVVESGDSLVGAVAARSASVSTDSADSARSPFVGLRGGFGAFAEALAERLVERGAVIETGVIARGLDRLGAAWSVTTGPTTDPVVRSADGVVVAVPAPAAARLLRDVARDAASALAGVEVASVGVISLAFARHTVGELPGSGFLVPPVEGRSIKAATFSSSKWAWLEEAHPDLTFLRASVGRAGETALLQRPDVDLVGLALTELGQVLGRSLPRPLDSHVQRWGGGLPQYAVGHLDRIRLVLDAVADVPGLEVAGAAYEGVGIPAVVGSGRRAARGVVAALSRQ